jgi:hypothetical protein
LIVKINNVDGEPFVQVFASWKNNGVSHVAQPKSGGLVFEERGTTQILRIFLEGAEGRFRSGFRKEETEKTKSS